MLFLHFTQFALSVEPPRNGNSAAMRMAMMPTTTSTSTIVKPVLRTNDFPFFISLPSFFEPIS